MEERIRLLSMVDIFEPLSFEEIENLNGHLPDRHLEQGEMLYIPEDSSERLFMLQKGKIRIFRTTPDGRELTLAIVESGTVFGEMSLTGQQLQGAYTQAMEPSEVSTMLRADLERLVLEKPEVGLKIMHLLSERLRRYETRLERGRQERHRLQDSRSLHPRAPRNHDRNQQGGCYPCLQGSPRRRGRGAQEASDLRPRHRLPQEISRLQRGLGGTKGATGADS